MRLGIGVLVLGVLVWRLGAGPFVDGVRMTSLETLLVATAITCATTICCAWRWQLVAERLGVPLDLRSAVAAVYRAQFLNATLPGGILGDVDRAAGHARGPGSVGTSVRSVVWERTLGQVVQVAIAVALLVALPSPLRPFGVLAVVVVGVLAATLLVVSVAFGRSDGLLARASRVGRADLVVILRSHATRRGIVLASAGSVAGHLAVFVIAAHVAGVSAPLHELLPLAAVVLLAASVPTNVAGWGPREGVAAWAFGAAGVGVGAGVTTAVVFGVMALIATLPGAVVLLVGRTGRDRVRTTRPTGRLPVLEGAVHG